MCVFDWRDEGARTRKRCRVKNKTVQNDMQGWKRERAQIELWIGTALIGK
jgi:hypothetical protein